MKPHSAMIKYQNIMHLFTHLRSKCALLLFGAVLWSGTAWADDTDGYYATVYTMDLSSVSTITSGWTTNGAKGSQTTLSDGSYGIHWDQNSQSGDRYASYSFANNTSFSTATDYIFEFDWGATTANTNVSTMTIQANNTAKKLFSVSIPTGKQTSYTVYASDGSTVLGTLTGDGYTKACPAKIFHFKIKGNETDGVTLTVTQGTTTVISETSVNESLCQVTGIYSVVGKIVAHQLFANVTLSSWVSNDFVEAPQITNDGLDYASKLVTISASSGTIKYTVNDGNEETYTEPFRIYKTSTIKAWAEKDSNSSSEVYSEITAGEIATPVIYCPIAAGDNNTATITCSTSGPSISYKLGDGEYNTYSSTITVEGETTVTAKAEYTEIVDGESVTFSSEVATATISPITLSAGQKLDFTSNYRGTAEVALTIGDDVITTVDGVDYYSLTMDTYGKVQNFAVEKFPDAETSSTSGYKWWLRITTKTEGLFAFSSADKHFIVQNVYAGQYVKIQGKTANSAFRLTLVDNGVAEEVAARSQIVDSTPIYVYKIVKNGTLALKMSKNSTLLTVEIFNTAITAVQAKYTTFYSETETTIESGKAAYIATLSKDQTTLSLSKLSGTIPAETAVIIETLSDGVDPLATETVEGATNSLLGTTEDKATEEIDGDVYVFSCDANGENLGFYKYAGATLAAGKAYLVLPKKSAPVARILFGETEEPGNVSGISTIEADAQAPVRIFDLQGRSLREVPAKGMYIINGKKVIR